MTHLEVKEIKSSSSQLYKDFLSQALVSDPENLLITAKDNLHAPFPTKDQPDSFTLGAYLNDILVGVISFDRDGEYREKLRHKGLVSTMYVSKQHRGKGIARKLLEELVSRIRLIPEIEQINLIVLSNNEKAKELYLKFGFLKYGTELHSIKSGTSYSSEDLMVLFLKNDPASNMAQN